MLRGVRWPLVFPFAYFAATRLRTYRDFGYNALMAWVPAWGLLVADGGTLSHATLTFLLGYAAFIAIYELGYLANDLWDARRDPAGRRRLPENPGARWIIAFALLRLILFGGIGWFTGWWAQDVWAGGYLALVLVFGAHNIFSPPWRLITFPILAILRFLLPIVGDLSPEMRSEAVLVAALPYMIPRWMAYAESKAMLPSDMRARPHFRSLTLLVLAPFVFSGAWLLQDAVPAIALGYYVVLTFLAERLRGGAVRSNHQA